MITSTVAPLWPPLTASSSLDSLCFLPSARDLPAANNTIRANSASRAPQVVVFSMVSLHGRFVPGAKAMNWAPGLNRRTNVEKKAMTSFQTLLVVLDLANKPSTEQAGTKG